MDAHDAKPPDAGNAAVVADRVERELHIRLDRTVFAGAHRCHRWVGTDDQYVVLVARGEAAQRALERERVVLDRLDRFGGCHVPQVLAWAPDLQVRSKMRGLTGVDAERQVFIEPLERVTGRRYHSELPISPAGARLAGDLGRALGRMHKAFDAREAFDIGVPRFQFAPAEYRSAVAAHVSPDLLARFDVIASRAADHEHRAVLCHGDVNHHNVASERGTGALVGIFDFEDMVVCEPALDFKFFPSNGLVFTTIAIGSYARETGIELSLERVRDLHVLSAAENLAYALEHAEHGLERCRGWLEEALRAFTMPSRVCRGI